MATDIRAIPTYYKGINFRSRLEARWAIIFDRLGIDWHYETEGYDIQIDEGYTIRYLPDFLLTGGTYNCPKQLYVEVKGNMQSDDALKIQAFSEHYPIYVVGEIPKDLASVRNGIDTDFGVSYYNFRTVNARPCGAVLGADKSGGWGLFGMFSWDEGKMDEARTRNAYGIARSAHFEF